ncbi:hypothetical protein ABEB36_015401 [Hypothenemus hampei]|uniref:C2H2-type domain-containing protein n=1 Tax=Hypothenemus hampei TaxID=57062 RepID=A0ABD1E043_HYPHA
MERVNMMRKVAIKGEDLKFKYCEKSFSKNYNLNRHLKNVHAEKELETVPLITKKCHIFCILCSRANINGAYKSYNDYLSHLQDVHEIKVEEKELHFNRKDEFEGWRSSERRDVMYTFQSFVSNCSKTISKTGGSIKMDGTCPSRIVATFLTEGPITVKYI